MDWLLDLGRTFLNKERVIQVSKVLLYLPIIIFAFAVFVEHYRFIGQILQFIYDIGLAVLCLALMVVVYKHNYKIPLLGYYVIITVIKGVYLFFITSIGTEHGELYTLIFVFSIVLHTITGIQLLRTDFSVFGKAFLYYLGGIVLASALSDSIPNIPLSIIQAMILVILIYPFYKELPKYY